jgi:hypothetical protein
MSEIRTKDQITIPMQVGSEFRIKSTGDLVMDNPEIELAGDRRAADAVLSYRFDRATGEHVLRLLDPVADHRHQGDHRKGD